MPKVETDVIDEATRNAVGNMVYVRQDMDKWKEVKRLAGITKGQWKRFQYEVKKAPWDACLRVSKASAKKLEIMRKHGGSPHLETLLKMAEAQMDAPS